MTPTIIVHTAEIKTDVDRRMIACLKKTDMEKQVRDWRREFPGRRITYKTIVEEVES